MERRKGESNANSQLNASTVEENLIINFPERNEEKS